MENYRSDLSLDDQIELIRVTSKMPVTSGLDKALAISLEPSEIVNAIKKEKKYYLDTEYPSDFETWGKKIQENWKQAVKNEEKRNKLIKHRNL